MSARESRLDEFLSLCERLAAEGKEVRASEVCDDEALVPELQRRLEALRRFNALAATGPPPPRADTLPSPGPVGRTPWPGGGPPAPGLDFLLPPEGPEEVGRLGPFRILGVLGRGGMGAVLHGHDPALGRDVAIKVMKPELAAYPEARARFLREARAAAAIDHPHVAPIFQVSEARGVPYLVMPLLRGQSLSDRLRHLREQSGRMPTLEAVRCARQMAEGLAAAHEKGTIHRDVKPANVWLKAPDGSAVLLDFGLALAREGQQGLTHAGAVLGTPSYMAPEQAEGREVDARADLFSLGCVLYEMLAGEKAYGGTSVVAVLLRLATHTPPPLAERAPGSPAELNELVGQLLCHSPQGRPTSALEVARRLQRIEEGLANPGIPSLPDQPTVSARCEMPPPERAPSWPLWSALAALLLVGLAAAGAAWWPGGTADAPVEAPLDGKMTAWVWSRARQVVKAELGADPNAVPAQFKDMVRVDASFNQPAHAFVVWIDSSGGVIPLYPWNKGDHLEAFTPGPAASEPATSVGTPRTSTRGWECDNNPGLETILVLARRAPLPDGITVGGLIGKLPANSYVSPSENTYQTFRDGLLVQQRPLNWAGNLRGIHGETAVELEDALLLAVKRLAPHFELIQAVRFAHVKAEE